MALYCWGDTSHGQLGLGGIQDEQILIPSQIPWKPDSAVQQIACGHRHTLFLTANGKVYACGSNDHYQLGHELPTKRPLLIPELQDYVVIQIACGSRHSMALTDWGQILSWGDNDCGQLGHSTDKEIIELPKVLRFLVSKTVVQIACGNNHSLALTSCGELYSWGSNIYGQLGVGSPKELPHCNYPLKLATVLGIPLATIACGGNHSFLISKSSAVFGWGKNTCGQLGLNDEQNRAYPTQLKTMRTLGVRFVACGDEYSVFLTNEGGVFTCGAGNYGQLGHGFKSNEMIPRMVMELMGSTITQVACGNRHTLALVPSRGRVYGFGLGSSGQLGTRGTKNLTLPQVVVGPWVSPSGSALLQSSEGAKESVVIQHIFSGGDQSIVTTTLYVNKVPPEDMRSYNPKSQILSLTAEATQQCAHFKQSDQSDLDLLQSMELIFKSQACLNGSFLLSNEKHFGCSARNYGLDLRAAEVAFDHLRNVQNESIKQVIWDNVTKELIGSLVASPADVESLRVYLLLPLYHEFMNSKHYKTLQVPLANAILKLTANPSKVLHKWLAQTPVDYFERVVNIFLHVVVHIISFKMNLLPICPTAESPARVMPYNADLDVILKVMNELFVINNTRKDRVSYQIFYWPELDWYANVKQEFVKWIMGNPNEFSICNFPFLFDTSAKTSMLQADQVVQMHSAMASAATNAFFNLLNYGIPISHYIVLNVTRENIVQDSIRELQHYSQSDLKKPLKIKFQDEEAEDAGGVRKEFFMLLLKDLLDPKYGMFKEFEESRVLWFADITFETENMYYLIGVLCGLAIYNFTIINLPFPLALYKKLLNKPVDLSDLRQLSPTEANSMQALLDYKGDDFTETFDLHFEITRDVFGEPETLSLKPNGQEIAVTLENRQEFVDLYVDFVINKASEVHYNAFHKGFLKVCSGRVLNVFQPEELMAVVVGNEEYDWQALQDNCNYKDGYSSGDETIKWFWEVIHDLSEAEKRSFLLYLTGSDRIPIQGMKALGFTIQPTNDERFLPVAHTCFNLLDLPRYKTKERLKFKLLQAIQQTQGFSLV